MLDFTVVIQVVQELFCLGKFIPWGHDNLCMHSLVMNTFITSQIETKKLRIHVQDKIGKSKCDFICTCGDEGKLSRNKSSWKWKTLIWEMLFKKMEKI